MGVSFKLDEDFSRKLRAVSNNLQRDAETTLLKCGDVLNRHLLQEVENNNVLTDAQKERLKRDIDNKILHSTPNFVSAEAGWIFDKYRTDNPPTGVIAIWMEYGTKERITKAGEARGFLHPASFVKPARKRASKEIEKVQAEILQKESERWLKTN